MYGTYLRLDVAVHDGNRAVIRAARRRLTPAARRDPAQRDVCKRFYRAMLRHHADAQELVARF
jgi:hypothetical protein